MHTSSVISPDLDSRQGPGGLSRTPIAATLQCHHPSHQPSALNRQPSDKKRSTVRPEPSTESHAHECLCQLPPSSDQQPVPATSTLNSIPPSRPRLEGWHTPQPQKTPLEFLCTRGLCITLHCCRPVGITMQSFLTPIGYENNSCGYCHNKAGSQSPKRKSHAPKHDLKNSLFSPPRTQCLLFGLSGFSYYASTTSLTPAFYQSLLDRGWRRSGSLLYKPDQQASCCPQYTIRLDSLAFRPSKDQRQSLNRFSKHILGDLYIKDAARLHPLSRDQAKKRNTEFDLVERVHESEKGNLSIPLEPAHNLSVTLEPDNFTEEKYALFENYQRLVHHEPPDRISKKGFKSFLCSSPLPRSKPTFGGRERRLGSYHQCYRIDGILIAVGVLDLLPQCVSAVYFMYHESVHKHGFGKIGALREIALAKEEGYKWWYAGFYIHSCVKMRYKGDYSPQYMLDPASYDWDLLDGDLKKKLDSNKYVSMSSDALGRDAADNTSSSKDTGMTGTAEELSSPNNTIVFDSDSDDLPTPNPDLILFSRGTPGILTKDQLITDIDLDYVKLRIRGQDAEACDLISWDDSSIDDPHSIKGIIAELAAAVGPELSREMIISFG
ncbi:hypothetical protein G7Y89_g3115 [Cudoniella acicularis]|uniref:arginyltransferase n=1 Tax=Cudoniella acicularis TaxID=354080 RepID=A0A8H4RTV9_9HELO|nr:hypothetical protein G7Y89_g3115 [Cudoniella acicularis]